MLRSTHKDEKIILCEEFILFGQYTFIRIKMYCKTFKFKFVPFSILNSA